MYDVIIVGGSYAGLSAGLALGRSLRNTLIIDSGRPCNRQTPHSHNFITHDGDTPAQIAAEAKKQVLQYPTVSFTQDRVATVEKHGMHFSVHTDNQQVHQTRLLLFATGIRDIMPGIPGYAECWGITVLHCPYCHGYEVKDKHVGIIANGELAVEYVPFIRHWNKDITLFTNGTPTFDDAAKEKLLTLGIHIETQPIVALQHQFGRLEKVALQDGRQVAVEAMYAHPFFEQHSDIPAKLGCEMTEHGYIQVDSFQATTQPGIYAAGDNTTRMRSVAQAVAQGAVAGAMMNRVLIFNLEES
ncbi:thioredoxin reductase [Chitinophaga skermanii]|uniref:Thioredoxin reductase n=1 Tax=Chitinophaga skermanii TaxID=331697 RepID=A0A327QXP3_9BACT|nr:NAD(P)/FAD-dependent oxidoreductase [Chitinophaga skermanii]RAJ08558.1 thioredoxin reductase [Chitinophaga skermanii]